MGSCQPPLLDSMAMETDKSMDDPLFKAQDVNKGAVICTMVQGNSFCISCQVAQNAESLNMTGCCYNKVVLIMFYILAVVGFILQSVFRGGAGNQGGGGSGCGSGSALPPPTGVEIALNGVGGLLELIGFVFFVKVSVDIRRAWNQKYQVDYQSDWWDCLCACCCLTMANTEVNLAQKGYINGGCCGAVNSKKGDGKGVPPPSCPCCCTL